MTLRTTVLTVACGFFVFRCAAGNALPGIVVRIEGATGFPHGKGQVEQFAHGMAQGDVATHAKRAVASIQRLDGRVVDDGGFGGVPEIFADEVVAFG